MSGIEVAGILLAVMPLFISALEDYNDGLDPVKAFLRWERELPQFIRKLRNQHVHYEQTLRLLLAPITTEFELAEMIVDPNGALWKEESMTEKLQEKLAESYKAYQGTIQDIERIMKKIASKLDLERASNLTRNELEAMLIANPRQANQKYEFRKRVRFGMNKKNIKSLLEELDECNKELERFTDRSEKLEPFRKASKPSFAKRLQRIQLYAKNLHQVLVQSWSCSCRSSHCTNLQLEQRISGYASGMVKRKKGDMDRGFCFTVAFSSDPGTWQEAEIQIQEHEVESSPHKPKLSKGVSWSSSTVPPPPYSEIPEIGSVPDAQTLQEINDLCSAIQKFQITVPCIGFSLDGKGKLRGAYPVTPRKEKAVGGRELITLEELLEHPPMVNGRPAKLTKRERYSLAVTLASSTLQLNSTPWFNDQWSKKDIVFHRISDGRRPVDIERPYVTQNFHKALNGTVVNGGPPTRSFHNKNTILLALAVALLELYFGVSAEQHQLAESFPTGGQSNPWTICAMAYEWTENEKENLSAAFLAAVTHCLRCFGDPGSSLQDPIFLQAAVEGILMPLQDELAQFLGNNAP